MAKLKNEQYFRKSHILCDIVHSGHFQHQAAVLGSRRMRPKIFLTSPDTTAACADAAPVDIMGKAHVTFVPEITQQ